MEKEKPVEARGHWASKREYILVVAGNVVGIGNVWRFPYLCYKNGGGAFLLPYGLFAVVFGIPLFLLEISIGQYTQEGFITCWMKICPLAKGIGFGKLIVSLCAFIYVIIEAWALFYLVFSFRAQLPWANCENPWNTANCLGLQMLNSSTVRANGSRATPAAIEFWERRVLGKSGGIDELGSVRWELALCLLACWALCYICVWKGVKSSGTVAYFTATFPYVMLLILLIRGMTLPGVSDGIYYYLYPYIYRLTNLEWGSKVQVFKYLGSTVESSGDCGKEVTKRVKAWGSGWRKVSAVICVDRGWIANFFSYSLTGGTLIVLGSYNDYKNNSYKDCFWLCLLNSGTSFVAGFVVFSVLGFMAHEQGVSVNNVTESGPGLAFIAYPQATALMPLPQFWTVCFFFVMVESFIGTVKDLFPKSFGASLRHEIFVLIVCTSICLLQLILVTEGGIYMMELIDFYGCTRASQYFIAICECLTVGWIVGADRFYDVFEDMTGQRPSVFFKLCWKYIIPVLSLISFILYLVEHEQLTVHGYVYPDWAYALGWIVSLSSVLMVPLYAAGRICFTAGTLRQRLSVLCRPVDEPAWQKRKTGEEGTRTELTTLEVKT